MEKLSEKQLEQLIVEKLNKKGGNIQKTDGQLKAFVKKKMDNPNLPEYLTDHEALLQRGYVPYTLFSVSEAKSVVIEPTPEYRLAARNGSGLSDATIEKIKKLINDSDDSKSE